MERIRNLDVLRIFDKFRGDDEERKLSSAGIASENSRAPILKGRADEDRELHRNMLIRAIQSFFLLISLFILIAIAVFQSKNKVGPSALTILDLIVVLQSLLHSAALLVVPWLHDRYGSLKSISRAFTQVRFGFVVSVTQCALLLIFALVNTISANVNGCKDPLKDPHADQEGYVEKLPGFCRDKRALTAFLYFALISWAVSLYFTFQQWRELRKGGTRIPPFVPPSGRDASEDDAFNTRPDQYDAPEMAAAYHTSPTYIQTGRISSTYYGSDRPFQEPPPTGYGSYEAPARHNPFNDPPQYTDPYDRIRAEMAMNEHGSPATTAPLQYSR